MSILEHSLTMSMEKITDEANQRQKRPSDQGPSDSSTSSQLESLSSTTRHLEMEPIPKKPRKSIEEDPVAQARKALEMFKEIEDEDADISITAEKIDKKTTTEQEEEKSDCHWHAATFRPIPTYHGEATDVGATAFADAFDP